MSFADLPAQLSWRTHRGETDPRKLPLVVALGFGDDVLRISGVKHVRIQGLVLRGATGSPLVQVYGSDHIDLDHLTIFGGFPGLLDDASQNIRVTHSAFRGLAAPWTSRAHMKYRGTATYQIVLQNNQPARAHTLSLLCSARIGGVKWNADPLPPFESTQICPPCNSTMRLAMASPRPVPPLALVLELST